MIALNVRSVFSISLCCIGDWSWEGILSNILDGMIRVSLILSSRLLMSSYHYKVSQVPSLHAMQRSRTQRSTACR